MGRFPADAPKRRVVKALERLGFRLVCEKEHIAMVRDNADGTQTPLTMPNHPKIKRSTLRLVGPLRRLLLRVIVKGHDTAAGSVRIGLGSALLHGVFQRDDAGLVHFLASQL